MERGDLKDDVKSRLVGYRAAQQIKEKELAALSHQDAMEITERLFGVAVAYRDPRRSEHSGLIDLQLYLKKLRV
ncbi:MAG: hypothetical protein RBS57_18250 [Desulforhabdus sp.]|jgi:hypothetical protein|nr:hypothetical protein [Desulforhabdus sp.]